MMLALANAIGALNRPGSNPNLLSFPTGFDNAAWAKDGATISADALAAPDGTTTADTLLETATTATHRISRTANITVTSGLSYTLSVHAKKLDRRYLTIRHNLADLGAFNNASIDLDTGLATIHGGAATATVQQLANGWYRLAISLAATVTGGSNIFFGPSIAAPTNAAPSYAGGTSSGVHLWGAKLEQASGPSAYP